MPQGTVLKTPLNSAWVCALAEPTSGLAILVISSVTTAGAPPLTANVYSPGCLAIRTGGSSASTSLLGNTGTAAAPVWTVFTIS